MKYVNDVKLTKEFLLPQVLSGIRIVLAISILHLIFLYQFIISFVLLLVACLSDIIDGKIARKLEVTSTFGAYFDVSTDFSLILIVFIGFVLLRVYPFWIIILICFMFFQFLFTSRSKEPVYDPVGKYIGTIHLIIIGTTLLFMYFYPNWVPYLIMLIILVVFDTISLVTRYRSIYKISRNQNKL